MAPDYFYFYTFVFAFTKFGPMSYVSNRTSATGNGVGTTRLSGCKSNSDFFLDGRSADLAIVFVLTSVVNFISETSDCFGIFNCLQCWW